MNDGCEDKEERIIWQVRTTKTDQRMIKSAAAEAKMAIGPFLAEAVRKTQIVRRSDWEAGLGKLIEAMALLEGISQRVAGMPDPLDRIETVAALLSVERRLHRIATPWLADDAEGDGA